MSVQTVFHCRWDPFIGASNMFTLNYVATNISTAGNISTVFDFVSFCYIHYLVLFYATPITERFLSVHSKSYLKIRIQLLSVYDILHLQLLIMIFFFKLNLSYYCYYVECNEFLFDPLAFALDGSSIHNRWVFQIQYLNIFLLYIFI